MTTGSSKSFGARLLKSQSLLTYISGFNDFNPPRPEEGVAGMTSLINSAVAVNASEVIRLENYRKATEVRAKAFRRNEGSIERLIPAIRGAVESQYGKPSAELSMIDSIIRRMRSSRHILPPTDPANPTNERSVHQTERSFGTVTLLFNDIVNCLTQFTGYSPANDNLKVASLQAYTQNINILNQNVSVAIQLLHNERAQRTALYKELKERVKRIRAYVKAQYGTRSNEMQLISRLGF